MEFTMSFATRFQNAGEKPCTLRSLLLMALVPLEGSHSMYQQQRCEKNLISSLKFFTWQFSSYSRCKLHDREAADTHYARK